MIYPSGFILRLVWQIFLARIRGNNCLPHVLMLEPTFRCNLACAGCGRLRENERVEGRMLTVEQCIDAVRESGVPSVCITGGEPLLYPEIGRIVHVLLKKRIYTHLATNGLLLTSSLGMFVPHPYFTFVIHIDGFAEQHDCNTGRPGSFSEAVNAIKEAKESGFSVKINITLYKGTTASRLLDLLDYFTLKGINGITISPAYNYLDGRKDFSLSADEVHAIFGEVVKNMDRYPFSNTPIYLEYLAGKRSFQCRPWSTPTRDPRGWKSPCYLIGDKYCSSFKEFLRATSWEKYGKGRDKRCEGCMMHSGFEAGAIQSIKKLSDLFTLARWATNVRAAKGVYNDRSGCLTETGAGGSSPQVDGGTERD